MKRNLAAVKKDLTPAEREMKARVSEAHELMAKVRKETVLLLASCDLMLTVLAAGATGPDAQQVFDQRTRRFYRAVQDTVAAADFYAQKFMVVGKQTPRGRWANLRDRMKTRWARITHNIRAWKARRAARRSP